MRLGWPSFLLACFAKAQPREALKLKGRSAPEGSAPSREAEVARLTRERDEALEQQRAISDSSHEGGFEQLSPVSYVG